MHTKFDIHGFFCLFFVLDKDTELDSNSASTLIRHSETHYPDSLFIMVSHEDH